MTTKANHESPIRRAMPEFDFDDQIRFLTEACELAAASQPLARREVNFVLGSDRGIGRDTGTPERRVGITAEQLGRMRALLKSCEIELNAFVIDDAGKHSDQPNAAYEAVGARIISEAELAMIGPIDVLHALKEPLPYETRANGRFLRIGALHAGAHEIPPGLAELVKRPHAELPTILDGSYVGAPDRGRVPIRGSMSRYAGQIGATWVIEHLNELELEGDVAVFAFGYAGRAAARTLLASDRVKRVFVFEDPRRPEKIEQLQRDYSHEPRLQFPLISGRGDPRLAAALANVVGCVTAPAAPGAKAPKVVDATTLSQAMDDRGIVVDIAIDEGGAIASADPSAVAMRQALAPLRYEGLSNMPRERPVPASEAHGEAVLPYLATLLFLAARHGSVDAVTDYLRHRPLDLTCPEPATLEVDQVLDGYCQDLRNGLMIHPVGNDVDYSQLLPNADRIRRLRSNDPDDSTEET
ncbi:MAG: hypothetical protein NXI31_13495 [bacterium]|nr:hypothetical protein [bacterium]